MTSHHWKPRSMGGNNETTMRLCITCHAFLHKVIPLSDVINYKTLESLEENWLFKSYLDFIRTKKHPNPYKVKKLIRSIFSPFVIKNYITKVKDKNPKKQHPLSIVP
jgi:hypothetical protein